jgi:hypothetical protein
VSGLILLLSLFTNCASPGDIALPDNHANKRHIALVMAVDGRVLRELADCVKWVQQSSVNVVENSDTSRPVAPRTGVSTSQEHSHTRTGFLHSNTSVIAGPSRTDRDHTSTSTNEGTSRPLPRPLPRRVIPLPSRITEAPTSRLSSTSRPDLTGATSNADLHPRKRRREDEMSGLEERPGHSKDPYPQARRARVSPSEVYVYSDDEGDDVRGDQYWRAPQTRRFNDGHHAVAHPNQLPIAPVDVSVAVTQDLRAAHALPHAFRSPSRHLSPPARTTARFLSESPSCQAGSHVTGPRQQYSMNHDQGLEQGRGRQTVARQREGDYRQCEGQRRPER